MNLDVNLKLLRSFEAVARHRSFTRAAAELGRSQATISSQVGDLEQQLGLRLVERTSRRVVATPAGEELAASLDKAFKLIADGLALMRDRADDRRGRIVVACVPSLSSVLLPGLLAAWRQRDKSTRIDVEELTSSEIVAALAAGIIDFGIGPCADPPPAGIAFTPATDEPLFVLLQQELAQGCDGGMPFARLVSLPLITLSGSVLLQRLLEDAALARGVRLSSHSEVRHVQTAVGMARAGVGAAVVPRLALPPIVDKGLAALPITEPSLSRKIGIITRRGAPLGLVASKLARHIRGMLAKGAGTPLAASAT